MRKANANKARKSETGSIALWGETQRVIGRSISRRSSSWRQWISFLRKDFFAKEVAERGLSIHYYEWMYVDSFVRVSCCIIPGLGHRSCTTVAHLHHHSYLSSLSSHNRYIAFHFPPPHLWWLQLSLSSQPIEPCTDSVTESVRLEKSSRWQALRSHKMVHRDGEALRR